MLNPEDIPGLPKVRKGTKTYFGTLCYHHPEHNGYRLVSGAQCVACMQERSKKIVGHAPDGTPISRSLANNRAIVDHASDGTPISRSLAASRAIVDHAPDGTPISRGLAISRAWLATPEGKAKHVAKGHAYYARLDENTRALNLSKEDVALTDEVVRQISCEGLSVDHMKPASKGGAHVWWNLNALTKSTNSSKSNKELDLSATPHWLEMLEQGRAPDYYQRLVSKILRGGNYEPE